jgi:hypothetical protein
MVPPEFPLLIYESQSKDDVTITTMLTVDRLPRLSQAADLWGGPISAAVYLVNIESDLNQLFDIWMRSPSIQQWVDIHIVIDDGVSFRRLFPTYLLL